MYRFFEKIVRFMRGRYGFDALGRFLMIIYFLVAFTNLFFRDTTRLVLYIVQTVILILIIWRMLSRNISSRQRENNFYLRTIGRVEPKIKLLFRRIKDIGKKRYRKCPNCKTIARLPIRRGRHTVRCPGCKQEYKVYIML